MRDYIIARCLSMLALFVSISINAYDFESGGIYYSKIKGNNVSVTFGGSEYQGDIVIPSQVTNNGITYSVTSIGVAAFESCIGLTSITIPSSVTTIYEFAFNCCGLTSITIPNSVTSIGDGAFNGCIDLTSITIPSSVTSIGEAAFSSCFKLSSIMVENGNTNYDSRNNCNAIIETLSNTLIAGCKNTIIPNDVVFIGTEAFRLCYALTSVTIPNSVRTIGNGAFEYCSGLTSISIPSSVTFIGERAFSSCYGLSSIMVENGNTNYDSRNNCNAIIETLSNTLIAGCKNTIIPNDVVFIGTEAFFGCEALTSITIPNSVTSIGDDAFWGCNSLTTITSEIETPFRFSIGAFSDNTYKVAELIVPKETKALYQATEGWNKFTKITEAEGEVEVSEFSVNGIYYKVGDNNTVFVTSGDVKYSGDVVIPSQVTYKGKTYSVTSIGNWAFSGCSGLISVSIPKSVTRIGHGAFLGCSSLTSISLPESLTWVGDEAFEGCTNLTAVYISNLEAYFNIWFEVDSDVDGNPLYYANHLYLNGEEIRDLVIPNSVTSINPFAFINCKGLKSVNIPNSVTSIGRGAFDGCTGLKSIVSEIEKPFKIDDNVFYNIPSDAELIVPIGTKAAYQATEGWNKFTKISESTNGEEDLTTQYLTFVAKENGTFSFCGTSSDKVDNSVIYYSLDSGASWAALARNAQSPTIQAGKRIMFKGTLTPLYYEVNGEEAVSGIGDFSSTGRFDVEGNIMSLLYGDNFIGQTNLAGKDHAFFELFLDCTGLVSADNLVLPATTLADNCYEGMFRNCTSLTIAPQLPATKLPKCCYEGMFYNCTSLITAPQLQATSLEISCYSHMFGFCTSLTIAPELPAVALAEKCYRSMFRGCISLTKAPQLPATTLTSQCYEYMFAGCASLKEITCLATNISASDCTGNWLSDVASTGTFTKSSSMNSWTKGVDGIPTNWTIQNDNGSSTNEVTINSISYVVDNSTLTAEVKSVDNSLRSVIIPESINYNGIAYRVTSLAERSFEGRDDITYLSIPSSINTIGEYAFIDCGSNIKVNIESLEAWCKVKFGNQHSSPLSSAKAFYLNDVEVKNLSIPSGVTSISSYAFYQCRSITSLSIPSTVTSIISSVFEDCTGLTSVTLSEGLTSIGGSSFEGCTGITSITIPSTVTSIALNAFKECNSLNDITSEIQQPFAIEENVFSTYSTATLKVPAGTKSAYQSTAGWSLFKNITDGQAEKDDVLFAIDGITYQGTKSGKTVLVTSVNNGLVNVEIPASVNYEGTTYQVTGLDDNALKGSSMAALIWNVEAVLPNNAFSNASIGSNFLLYVKSSSYAPSSVKNVVVDGTAQTIVLSDDGGQFYCPQAFTARNISYTHNYSMETNIGKAKGWESLALPFDVQKISHNTRGEIVPFPSYNSSSTQKPFWLANFSGSGFRRTAAVLANEPYIIAMPNSSSYRNEYNLAGDVTFSADNVQVPKTPSFSGTFVPAFAPVSKSSSIKALNNAIYSGGYDPGSRFIPNLRDVHPFEAYMTGSSSRGIVEIYFDDSTTDMLDILFSTDDAQEVLIHSLSGQQVTRTTKRDYDVVWHLLPKGVYIINGKKMIK